MIIFLCNPLNPFLCIYLESGIIKRLLKHKKTSIQQANSNNNPLSDALSLS